MAFSGPCPHCATVDLSHLWPGAGVSKPDHCYGHGDIPAAPGCIGGFVCSCECRHWPIGAPSNRRAGGTPNAE